MEQMSIRLVCHAGDRPGSNRSGATPTDRLPTPESPDTESPDTDVVEPPDPTL